MAQADPVSWQSLAHSGKLSRALDKEDPATPWIKKLRVRNLEPSPEPYTLRIAMPCTCGGCVAAHEMKPERGGATKKGLVMVWDETKQTCKLEADQLSAVVAALGSDFLRGMVWYSRATHLRPYPPPPGDRGCAVRTIPGPYHTPQKVGTQSRCEDLRGRRSDSLDEITQDAANSQVPPMRWPKSGPPAWSGLPSLTHRCWRARGHSNAAAVAEPADQAGARVWDSVCRIRHRRQRHHDPGGRSD